MTVHYHQDYQCVRCDTFFIPFQSPVTVCPECGEPNLQAEEFREIVKLLVDANAKHKGMFNHFTPPAYGVFSLVDHYIYYTATVFDMYMERQSSKALIIEELIAGETPNWQEHLRELMMQLFEEAERQGLLILKEKEETENEAQVEGSIEEGG
jgi:hypothetical protein